MPSIRIKGQVYSTLEDAISTNGDNLCLQGELPGGPPSNTLRPYSHTPNVHHKFSLPLLPRGQLDVPSPLPHGRPRSASSRVYAHCINTSRNSQYSQPPPSPLSNTKSMPTSNVGNATTFQEMMTIEGALTDVRAPSHVDPGIVESSTDISTDDEDSQFSGHHHDDVVEHLDVIGTFSSLSHLKFKIIFYYRFTSWYHFESHQCRKFYHHVSLPIHCTIFTAIIEKQSPIIMVFSEASGHSIVKTSPRGCNGV